MGGTGLGEHLLGVLTRAGSRPSDGPRRRRELQQWPGMVNEPYLGIVDLDQPQPSARKDLSASASPGGLTVVIPDASSSSPTGRRGI